MSQRKCERVVAAYVALLRSLNSDDLVEHLHTVVRQRVELNSPLESILATSSLFIDIMRAALQKSPPEDAMVASKLMAISTQLVNLSETIVKDHYRTQTQTETKEDVIDAYKTWHPPLEDAFRITEADKALLEAQFAHLGWPLGEERIKADLAKAASAGEPVDSALLLSSGCLVNNRFKIVEFVNDGPFKNGFIALDLRHLQVGGARAGCVRAPVCARACDLRLLFAYVCVCARACVRLHM